MRGPSARALAAATRAALLWERLGRPGARGSRAARSCCRLRARRRVARGRRRGAGRRVARARVGRRARAAFARWAVVETRAPGRPARTRRGPRRRSRARCAPRTKIASAPLRALLVWARGRHGVRRTRRRRGHRRARVVGLRDRALGVVGSTRAALGRCASDGEARVPAHACRSRLAELVALLDVAAPLGSRGPALAAGARLAAELGDGDVARRLETARRARRGGAPRRLPARASRGARRPCAVGTARRRGGRRVVGARLGAGRAARRDRALARVARSAEAAPRAGARHDGAVDRRRARPPPPPRAGRRARSACRAQPRASRSARRAARALDGPRRARDGGAPGGRARPTRTRRSAISTPRCTRSRLRSVLAVPLVARGDVLGVVYLDDRVRRGAFGAAELGWVRLVASQAALAIADARDQALLRRAVRRAERANATPRGRARRARGRARRGARRARAAGGDTRFRYDEIVGRSEPMRAMLRLVDRVTASEVPVLLAGESGTGKELVARAIHANGARSSRPFVSENCALGPGAAARVDALRSRARRVHRRLGDACGALRRGGRRHALPRRDRRDAALDADEAPARAPERRGAPGRRREGRTRSTSASSARPIATSRRWSRPGPFREDLFYRLNVVSIRVPSLRERAADIPLLVAHFVEKHAEGRKVKVTRAAMDRLAAFPWPGNVRQLENEIRRAFVLADDRIDVARALRGGRARGPEHCAERRRRSEGAASTLSRLQLVKDALERTKGNQTRAAEALGISRFGLQKMMKRLGIRTGCLVRLDTREQAEVFSHSSFRRGRSSAGRAHPWHG